MSIPQDSAPLQAGVVSAIVPTIGRPDSLIRLLESLALQTRQVQEVIIADGSSDGATRSVAADPRWHAAGLRVTCLQVHPPHAVRQRRAAIAVSSAEFLLLLDDDVVLETDCVQHLLDLLQREPGTVAVCSDFNNYSWSGPTAAWRFYMRHVLGMPEGAWQGRVVGPLLRFGYYRDPKPDIAPMEWLTTANTMLRRSAYDAAGGFSDFFLHRSTMNEDLDLGLKVAKVGAIRLCRPARVGHFHAPGGRVSIAAAAEDDLFNRFLIMRRTQGRGFAAAFGLVSLFLVVETASNFIGGLRRASWPGFWSRTGGRVRAVIRALAVRR